MSRPPAEPAPEGARRPASSSAARAGQTALLWRLAWLLVPVVAALLPSPGRDALLLVWGGAALAALAVRLVAPGRAATLWVPPAPAMRPLLLLGLGFYGLLAGTALATGTLALAGQVLAPLAGVSLVVLLPGRDTALAVRTWALAVGGALWATAGTLALAGVAAAPSSSVPLLVSLALALGAWSAARRALVLQGLRPALADSLALIVGLTALVVTTTAPLTVLPLAVGFIGGVLLASATTRLLPTPAAAPPGAVIAGELIALYHQFVFAAGLTWLVLFLLALRAPA